MARGDPQINVRVPPEVKRWLDEQATCNMRSLNAEVVMAIRERMAATGEKFGDPTPADAANNSIQENADAAST